MKLRIKSFVPILTFASGFLVTISSSCAYNASVISFKGSNSMMQFLSDLSKVLDKKFEMNISGGGSGSGLSLLLENRTDFASLSKEPRHDISEENKELFIKNRIKTILVAKENLVFVVRIPKSKMNSKEFENTFKNHPFYFNENNWKTLLNSFGGQNELTLFDIATTKIDSLKNEQVIPIYKSGGTDFSGTPEALVAQNPYLDITLNNEAKSFLENTQSKTKYPVELSNDSSSETWIKMKNMNKISIAFFPLDFVKKNLDNFKNNDAYILNYLDASNNKKVDPLDEIQVENYPWKRGFYLSFSLNTHLNKKVEFLQVVFAPPNRAKMRKVYQEDSLTYLNTTNPKIMQKEILDNFNLKNDSMAEWDNLANLLEPDFK